MILNSRPTVLHAWLLAAVLLLAQGLGMAHGFAHAPSVGETWSQDHEAGGAECRLIDQLAHADALCGGSALVPVVVAACDAVVARPGPVRALAAPAAYLARAPPGG